MCEDDDPSDEEHIEAVSLYLIKKRRLQTQLVCSFLQAAETVVKAYVEYRGGMNAIMNFDVKEPVFDWDTYCDKLFAQDFRFSKSDVEIILDVFVNVAKLPSEIVSYAGDKASLRIAFLCMCMKYAWPTRLGKICQIFGKGASWISRIVKTLRQLLFSKFHHKMRHPSIISFDKLQEFTAAVARKSGITVCFGFLDGTVRPVCKPSEAQAEFYTGKDRLHALKYQIVSTPDGMIQHIDGPWPGRRHDGHMLTSAPLSTGTAVLHTWLMSHPKTVHGTVHVIYADAGYTTQACIETPWPDADFNLEHAAYNEALAASRIAVEWEFGHILELWASHHMRPQQKVLSNQKIGQVYCVCAFLSNVFNCMHPNKTANYFGVKPPTIGAYISSLL